MHHAESGPDGAIVAGGMLSLNLVTSSSSKKRKKQKRLFSDFMLFHALPSGMKLVLGCVIRVRPLLQVTA